MTMTIDPHQDPLLEQCRTIAIEAAERINESLAHLKDSKHEQLEQVQTLLMRIDWCLRHAGV